VTEVGSNDHENVVERWARVCPLRRPGPWRLPASEFRRIVCCRSDNNNLRDIDEEGSCCCSGSTVTARSANEVQARADEGVRRALALAAESEEKFFEQDATRKSTKRNLRGS